MNQKLKWFRVYVFYPEAKKHTAMIDMRAESLEDALDFAHGEFEGASCYTVSYLGLPPEEVITGRSKTLNQQDDE